MTAYDINKSTFARFFSDRLGSTMPNLTVEKSAVGGDEKNPTMYIKIDNKAVESKRASVPSLPKPIAIAISASTDGRGGGRLSMYLYNVSGFGSSRLFDNTNHNLKAWGYSVADDSNVSSKKMTVDVSGYDVGDAATKLIENVRTFCKRISDYTP